MKKACIFVAGLILSLSGCSGKPSEAFAKEYFKKSVLAKYTGRAEVTAFKEIKATEGEFLGVKFYDMEYDYELACNSAVQIKGLELIPAEDVALLEDFLKSQTGDWDKINFGQFSRLRINSAAMQAIHKAYSEKTSLFFCRFGDKLRRSGGTRFLLRENGWEAERP